MGTVSLWTRPEPTLQARFEAWLRTPNGQAVYREVLERAIELHALGVRHYGIAGLFESARYARAAALGRDDEGFSLNNSYRSRLARRLMRDYPALEGMFKTRELRS